jgi:hypothetical protein
MTYDVASGKISNTTEDESYFYILQFQSPMETKSFQLDDPI